MFLLHSYLFLSKGLPADSLALDEQHIFWSSDDNPSLVFYVARSNRSFLGTLVSSTIGSVIFTLSPGQQPLPPAGNDMYNRYTHSMMGVCALCYGLYFLST